MKVSAWNDGGNTYGIYVGKRNRDKYFDAHWESIEVLIAVQLHTFKLTPGFWNKCPEFRDSGSTVIRDWLRVNHSLDWPDREPPRMELLRLEGRQFKLVD